MAQATDYVIVNANGAPVRADMNTVLAAIASMNSGASEPTNPQPYMPWGDTANNLIKIRNPANSAWVTIASLSGTLWVPYRDGSPLGTAAIRNTGTTPGTLALLGASAVFDPIVLPTMVGATGGADGTKGTVPAPAAGDQNKVLTGGGTWVARLSGLANNYFARFPVDDGTLVLMSGVGTGAAGTITITYPLAYTIAPHVVAVADSSGQSQFCTVNTINTTQFNCFRQTAAGPASNTPIYWQAFGVSTN